MKNILTTLHRLFSVLEFESAQKTNNQAKKYKATTSTKDKGFSDNFLNEIGVIALHPDEMKRIDGGTYATKSK